MRIMERFGKVKLALEGTPLRIKVKTLALIPFSFMCYLLPRKYYLVNYPGGKIYLKLAEYPTMFARMAGVYEYLKTRLFCNFVKPGMTVLDIGVNKGYFSLLSAKLMGDKGTVISVEPSPTNAHWIRKSIKANNYKSIKMIEAAISDRDGRARLYIGKISGWNSLVPSKMTTDNTTGVRTMRVDTLLKREKVKKVDIIKIDTEGAEEFVIRGALNTLKNNRNILVIIELHDNIDRKALFSTLENLGFRLFKIRINGIVPITSREREYITEIVAARDPGIANSAS